MKLSRSKKKRSFRQNQFSYTEIFRQLRTNIEYSSFGHDIQVLNITSANPMEGKSTVAKNLAVVGVARYDEVLLIDGDLRKPKQHKNFNVSNKLGLSNLMKNLDSFNVFEDTYFQKFKDNKHEGKLYLLTAGSKVPNPGELFSSETFEKLIKELRKRFKYIIIDCPPINAVADAIPISRVCDGTVFVVSAKDTDKHEAKNALEELQRNGAHILGSVLTMSESEGNTYGYYYSD